MSLSDELLNVIVCPQCKGDLQYERNPDKLLCQNCKLIFRVEDDIPVLLLDEAEKIK
jgi:uncharacterized protein YbaR (Trm112 family)